MCVNPIKITRKSLDGSSKTMIVPCGKCEECKSKKHSDFAALAVLEAKRADSMHFLTFTYRNDKLPIMKCTRLTGFGIQQKASDNEFIKLSSRYHKLCIEASSIDMEEFRPVKSYTHTRRLAGEYDDTFIDVVYTPSLRREDMRLFIKRCREDWYREHGSRIDCRYTVFGEYGSATFRPHYHAIFFNLTDEQAFFLRDQWRIQFGYADCYSIPVLNSDGSPGRLKVANYVSKYIAKGDEYEAVALNLVERPRRLSSKGFGVRQLTAKEVQSFKNFTNVPI